MLPTNVMSFMKKVSECLISTYAHLYSLFERAIFTEFLILCHRVVITVRCTYISISRVGFTGHYPYITS